MGQGCDTETQEENGILVDDNDSDVHDDVDVWLF
jgi:hypothetical protein